MMLRGLETRLRKLEGRHPASAGPWFVIWGRTAAEIEATMEAVRLDAKVTRLAQTRAFHWPFPDAPPAPHWVQASDGSALSLRELDALIEVAPDEPDDPRAAGRLVMMSNEELMAAIFERQLSWMA